MPRQDEDCLVDSSAEPRRPTLNQRCTSVEPSQPTAPDHRSPCIDSTRPYTPDQHTAGFKPPQPSPGKQSASIESLQPTIERSDSTSTNASLPLRRSQRKRRRLSSASPGRNKVDKDENEEIQRPQQKRCKLNSTAPASSKP
ncbi:hypothetical protein VM1G_11846 [Cytospora mali]|uniref:Uncharacterized protein n=1 Tax=Cytospora mali TaxID=578113 RepID=A0A194W962_CYTMA|nr:hypothetical protein VM1G_11846 [Valsa mali]